MVPLAERFDGGPVDGDLWAHHASMIPPLHAPDGLAVDGGMLSGPRTKEAVVHGTCSIPHAEQEDARACARAPRPGARQVGGPQQSDVTERPADVRPRDR